jgi:hypothetical protein
MSRQARNHCLLRLGAVALAIASIAAAPAARAGWNPFSHGDPIEVGPQSGQLAMADFTSDGHVDILVNHPLGGKATLIAGDGSGTFAKATRTTIEFGYDPAAIAVGDLNGDKHPDLAVATRTKDAARVHILLSDAAGAFKEISDRGLAVAHTFNNGWKPSLALTDVNNDGRLDLVAANGRQASIEIFYGTGAGQFAAGQTIELPSGSHDHSYVIEDLNGDARPDLIAAGAPLEEDAPSQLAVYFGDERGELIPARHLSAKLPARARVKTLADIDGDKLQDIVLTHGKQLTVLAQAKDGALAPSTGSPFDVGREAFGIVAVSVGYSGNDVLVAATADSLEVVFADEQGEFRHACHTPMAAGPGAYQVATGDINGDGKLDVTTNSFEGTALTVLLSSQ